MSDWMIFAERLSEQIKKQNLSIRQLAKRMDMTPTTIFRYAKGQRVPRASEILKASDVLGVTCDYLVGLSDDPKKTSRPSAQPEIIRCKDCRYYKTYQYVNGIRKFLPKCSFNDIYVAEEDFCSQAERIQDG